MCDDVITVFNGRVDPATGYAVYAPTVLRGCRWFSRAACAVTDSGLVAKNLLTARIPMDVDAGGKRYAEPAAYRAAEDASELWTLQKGDAVVRGAASGNHTPATLRAAFDQVFTVVGVTDNTGAKRGGHWKVVGE